MNGVVTIPITSLNPQSIPANLNGLIDPNQWSHICTALVNRKGDSFCMTCAIEFGICCITGFFCIFCCHGCLENVVQQGTLEGETRQLNKAFYGGAPVLGFVNGSLTINPNYLPSLSSPMNNPSAAVTVQYAEPPMAQAVVSQPIANTVLVTIPQDSKPGQILSVVTPTGSTIQFTVPHGAVPGQQIAVNY